MPVKYNIVPSSLTDTLNGKCVFADLNTKFLKVRLKIIRQKDMKVKIAIKH